MSESFPLLVVEDLQTYFYTRRGVVKAVDGVSFTLQAGETLALVGESGSGKSVTCLSLVRLVPEPAGHIVGGRVLWQGEDLLPKSAAQMRRVRGKQIAMVLQDPMTSLNPALMLGTQVAEVVRLHQGLQGSVATPAGPGSPDAPAHSRSGGAPAPLPPSAQRRHAAAGE